MSHILDALRQAEDERRLGQPPGRSAIASPLRAARRQRRPVLAWLIVSLLLAGLAAVVWLARIDRGPQSPTPIEAKAAPPKPSLNAPEAAAAATPMSGLRAPPAPEATASAPRQEDPKAAPEPAEEEAMPRAQLAEADSIDSLDALFQSSSPTAQAASDRRTPSDRDEAPLQPTDIYRETDGVAGANAQGATESAGTASGRRDTRAQAPEWFDLPRASSVGMPAISIDVHVYNDNPDRRFVLVNGQRRVEGDVLDNGAVIERIAADGLILEWRGMRVARPLSR